MIDNEIQSRMDAYRGNPQALMQRYAQSQQLIDLLALQKLKSEKEAAARQMQMQAGQGQMPTVAQQREQELLGMAKQEVAQRVGQVAQQQAQQQQENLQRMAQTGIAQAPALNVMSPKAMAAGGIVAFNGETGSQVKQSDDSAFTRGVKSIFNYEPATEEETARIKRIKELQEIRSQFDTGPFQGAFTLPAQQYDINAAVRNYISKNGRELVDNPQLFSAFKANPEAFVAGKMNIAVGRITPAQTAPTSDSGPAQASYSLEGRSVPTPKPAAPAPKEPPTGIFLGAPEDIQAQLAGIPDPAERQAAAAAFQRQLSTVGTLPSPAQQSGIAGALPAAQGQVAEANQLQAPLEKSLVGALEASPEARATAAEADYAKRYGPLYQQQRELAQQGIAQLQQRMAAQPKQDPLTEFLRGMSTQRTLGMALGAGGAGMNAAQRANLEQQAELQDQLQKLRADALTAQVTQETARYGAGKEAAKAAREAQEKAMQAGTTYAVGMENAKIREEAAQLRAQQVADRALMAKTLTPAQLASMKDKAADNVTARLNKGLEGTELQIKLKKGEVTRAALEHEEFIKLISEAAPELAAQMRAATPTTAGSAIPPPPVGAVQLMSKGK